MFPVGGYHNMCMDSYPNTTCHPYTHFPTYPPASYGPFYYPYGGGYPAECRSCSCNHNMYQPSGCHTLPPPPPPPPAPVYYPGPNYAANGFFPPYHAPFHNPVEQPRYEFDKDHVHACKCPNHHGSVRQDNKGVRIEELEPGTGNKESGSSAPPPKFRNDYPYPYPYPVMLLPPRHFNANPGSNNSSQFAPNIWNGCYPFDGKNDIGDEDAKSLQRDEDEKGSHNQRSEDKTPQFPFPMFWIPGYDNVEKLKDREDVREDNTSPKIREEHQPKLKIVPVNPPANNLHLDKPKALEGTNGNGALAMEADKKVKIKDIPVQHAGENYESRFVGSEGNTKKIEVKPVEENKNKSFDGNANGQSPSPRKASKLPPVCLRVDPLPRKKVSRSPSSHAAKSKETVNVDKNKSTLKVPSMETKASLEPQELQQRNKNEAVEEKERVDHWKEVRDVSNKEISRPPSPYQEESCERKNTSEAKETVEKEGKTLEETMAKKALSATEAAVIIQSFYRGFEVRRWEPLKKLKQIAKVREQAGEVMKRVQLLESSIELQKDDKQRMLLGETIMSLLLQLDTIQGLHQSVRNIRKSVANELVCMQKRLDSIVSRNLGEKEKLELMQSAETNQERGCEDELHSEHKPPGPTGAEDREQLLADMVKEAPNRIKSMNECHPTLSVLSTNGEEPSFKAIEDVEKATEASHCGTEELLQPIADASEPVGEQEAVLDKIPPLDADENQESVVHNRPPQEKSIVYGQSLPDLDNREPQLVKVDSVLEDDGCVMKDALSSSTTDKAHMVVVEVPQQEQLSLSMPKSTVSEDVDLFGIVDTSGPVAAQPKELPHEFIDEIPSDLSVPAEAQLEDLPEVLNKISPLNAGENEALSEVVRSTFPQKGSLTDAGGQSLFGLDMQEPVSQKEDFILEGDGYLGDDVLSMMEADVPQQEQSSECLAVGEIWHEEPAVVHENDICPCSDDTSSIVPSFTGTVLMPRDDTEATEYESQHDRSNDPLVESKESHLEVITEYPCTDLGSPKSTPADGFEKVHSPVDEVPEQISGSDSVHLTSLGNMKAKDEKLIEENDKLRELIGRLIQEGKQQLTVISDLNGRVKHLERMLSKKKKLRVGKRRTV